jgi:hypothetical protein
VGLGSEGDQTVIFAYVVFVFEVRGTMMWKNSP